MKNLLTKISFILLLLSASIPFGVQAAGLCLEKAAAMGKEISKAAILGVTQGGQKTIPMEVVALAAMVPPVIATIVVGATGDLGLASRVGVEVASLVGKGMILAGTAVLVVKITAAIKRQ